MLVERSIALTRALSTSCGPKNKKPGFGGLWLFGFKTFVLLEHLQVLL
jgi:hypothetical protein